MGKLSRQKIWQAIAFLVCAGVLWIRLSDFGASEFSGGSLTGKILTMADIGALLFLCALVFTAFVPRIVAIVALLAITLCLPLYLFVVMPRALSRNIQGEYSAPLQGTFVWNSWAVVGIITLILAAAFSMPLWLIFGYQNWAQSQTLPLRSGWVVLGDDSFLTD